MASLLKAHGPRIKCLWPLSVLRWQQHWKPSECFLDLLQQWDYWWACWLVSCALMYHPPAVGLTPFLLSLTIWCFYRKTYRLWLFLFVSFLLDDSLPRVREQGWQCTTVNYTALTTKSKNTILIFGNDKLREQLFPSSWGTLKKTRIQPTQPLQQVLLPWKQKGLIRGQEWIIPWDVGMVLEGGGDVCSAGLCLSFVRAYVIVVLEWRERGVWRRCNRINTLEFSFTFFSHPCSKTPVVITRGGGGVSAGASKINIPFLFVTSLCVELCITTLGGGAASVQKHSPPRNVKEETQEGGALGGGFYSLSTSCWVMVCPIQLPPPPPLHTHLIQGVGVTAWADTFTTNLHFPFPAIAHYIWILNV